MYTGSVYTCMKVASVHHTIIKHSNQGKPGTETNICEGLWSDFTFVCSTWPASLHTLTMYLYIRWMTQSLQNIHKRELTHTRSHSRSLKGTEGKMWDVSEGQMIRHWDAMSEIALLIQLQNNIKVLHVCCS